MAFSNAEGGALIIGVGDNGAISGLSQKDIQRLNQLISNTANENVKPPVYPLVEVETIQDKTVMIIHVKKRNQQAICHKFRYLYNQIRC